MTTPSAEATPPPTVLVLYASTHGHTRRIAQRIRDGLEDRGIRVVLADAPHHETPIADAFDAVVLAGSVHAGHHDRALRDYARRNHQALNARPSALLSVSLTAADDTDEGRATAQGLIDDFLHDTRWTPAAALAVAGALQFEAYDPFTRLLMRAIARRHGVADVHHDHDFTDWPAIDVFTAELAAGLPTPTGAAS